MPRRKFNLNWKQALGEVILIFIGITLAIAFQNWNEEQKEERLAKGYYERLLAELRQDVVDIEDISDYHRVRQRSIETFFRFLDNTIVPNPDSLQYIISRTSYHMNTYVPNENTYKELISTGNIKLIKTRIREKLLRLSQMHAYVVSSNVQFRERYDNRRDQVAEVIDEASFYDYRNNPERSLLSWQRNTQSQGFQRYSNLLAVRLNIAQNLLQMYGVIDQMCDELITLIQNELNIEDPA